MLGNLKPPLEYILPECYALWSKPEQMDMGLIL